MAGLTTTAQGQPAVHGLPSPRSHHAVVVHDGRMYLVGGFTTGQARLQEDGTLGAFEQVEGMLPVARAHVHQTPLHNGRVYSVGGRLSPALTTMDRVFIGTFLMGD